MPDTTNRSTIGRNSLRELRPLLSVYRGLRRIIWEERWQTAERVGRRAIKAGLKTIQLRRARRSGQEHSGVSDRPAGPFVALMRSLARSGDGRRTLLAAARIADRRGSAASRKIARELRVIAKRGYSGSKWLQQIAVLRRPHDDRLYVEHASVGLVTRGLLGVFIARLNRKMQTAARSGVDRSASQPSLHRCVADATQEILGIERELHKSRRNGHKAVQAKALKLAAACARWIPKLADAQAPVVLTLWDDLRKGHPTALSTGKILLKSSAITREALAAYAAAYRLFLDLPDAQGKRTSAQSALADLQIPFDVKAGPVPAVPLDALGRHRDGSDVEILGFVRKLLVRRTSHGELIGLAALCDPQGKNTINAVAKFAHFAHWGMTPGACVKVKGILRRQSRLNGNNPAIEVLRESLAEESKRSWRTALLQSAEDYYRWKPNGLQMLSTVGPQRRRKDGVSFGGAGEAIWPPLVRGRGKQYST